MQRRGANLVIEASSTLKVGAGLDVTADVLAGLNAALAQPCHHRSGRARATPPRR